MKCQLVGRLVEHGRLVVQVRPSKWNLVFEYARMLLVVQNTLILEITMGNRCASVD